MLKSLFKAPHPAVQALETAVLVKSSPKEYSYFWAFRHPNADMPPETFRLSRRHGAGWFLLLVASRETGEVYNFNVETAEDRQAVEAALPFFGLSGKVEDAAEGAVLKLSNGRAIAAAVYGGEKPKKK